MQSIAELLDDLLSLVEAKKKRSRKKKAIALLTAKEAAWRIAAIDFDLGRGIQFRGALPVIDKVSGDRFQVSVADKDITTPFKSKLVIRGNANTHQYSLHYVLHSSQIQTQKQAQGINIGDITEPSDEPEGFVIRKLYSKALEPDSQGNEWQKVFARLVKVMKAILPGWELERGVGLVQSHASLGNL